MGYALTKCDMSFVLGNVEFSKPIPRGASPELFEAPVAVDHRVPSRCFWPETAQIELGSGA